ncbi:hypothetical protein LOK49_Contig58G00006 [Camellia lanceoleosa]|nr:hypothetical protein LOK49_Contig58G00006 [Camellia lanceoleosa]
MPSWSFSAREAAEPEERAAEEKRVESKSEEKKTEKIGSEERESSGDDENGMEDGGDVMVPAAEVGVAVLVVLSLKVERRWRGAEEGIGDLGIAGAAIVVQKAFR